MKLAFLTAGVLCALVVANSGSAARARAFQISLGDQFVLANTDIGCDAEVGKSLLKGKKLIACYRLTQGKPAVGSYSPALTSDGSVAVAKANADGSATVVFKRKPMSVGAASRSIAVKPGDELLLKGTDLACAISKGAPGIYVSCFLFSKTGGQPNSYGIAETEDFAAVVKFNAAGTKSKAVFTKRHGT